MDMHPKVIQIGIYVSFFAVVFMINLIIARILGSSKNDFVRGARVWVLMTTSVMFGYFADYYAKRVVHTNVEEVLAQADFGPMIKVALMSVSFAYVADLIFDKSIKDSEKSTFATAGITLISFFAGMIVLSSFWYHLTY